jgi:APA family basic amino acid/polyamine antiporter
MQNGRGGEGAAARPGLVRELGAWDAAAIMVSNMIGVGILTFPGIVALALGDVRLALAAWAAGGLASLAGALVHAELGSRHPQAGGDYVFLREAFGLPAAFLSGWTSFVVGFPGAIAASSFAAAQSLVDASGRSAPRGATVLLALALLLGLSAVHAAGLRQSRRFQNGLVVAKLAILGGLVAGGLLATPPAGGGGRLPPGPPPAIAALIVLFAYSGWNSAAYVAGEVREPRKNLPRALVGGVLLVTLLYLAWNLAYFRMVPVERVGTINVGGEIARSLFGERGMQLLSLALAFVFAGSASAMVVTGPRIYFSMAQDGLFPRAIGAVSAGGHVPARALWLQTLWSAAILLAGAALTPAGAGLGRTFETIVDWTAFAILPFAALTTASVFVLRRREAAAGVFRAPFHPFTPLLFIGAALAVEAGFVLVGLRAANAAIGTALVLSGVPAYLFWRRRAKAAASTLLVVALAGAAVPARAAAPPAPAVREDWRKVDAGPVTVVGTASDARLAETAVTLRALVALFPGLVPGAFGPPPPLVAAVVRDRAQLAGVGIPAAPSLSGRIVLAAAGDEEAREGLLRAAAAALARRTAPAAPAWLAAGLGEYLSTFAASATRATLGRPVPGYAALLRGARSSSGPFAAASLEGDDEASGLRRAEAWSVVHYLLHGAPDGAGRLGRYVALCAGGGDPQSALREALGVDARGLLSLARDWATEARPLARYVAVPEGAPPVGRLLPLTRAGAAGVLGGAARGRNAPEPGGPAAGAAAPRPTVPARPPGALTRDVPAEVDRVNRLVDEGREEEALARLEALHASLGYDPEMQKALGWDVAEVRRVVLHNRLVRRYNVAIGLLNADRTAEALAIFREVAERAEDPGLRRLAWERATSPDGGRR